MTIFLLVSMLGLLGQPRKATAELVLGILEQTQCTQDPSVAVRAMFARRGQEWVALTSREGSQGVSLPAVWTVGLHGKTLGRITTSDPGFQTDDAWTFPRDRLLLVTPGQPEPEVGNKQRGFAGWCDPPTRRPLVVVSRPTVQDPDRWKPYRPVDALRSHLFEDFTKHAGAVSTCPADPEVPTPLAYGSRDLVFFPSYQDRSGKRLVVLGLDVHRNTCDGPPGPGFAPHSFLLGNEALYLGSNLTLVDAGDYDSDGASEVLFWYSGYNDDGYTLFYDGFRKHVDYHWNYH